MVHSTGYTNVAEGHDEDVFWTYSLATTKLSIQPFFPGSDGELNL